MSINRCVSRLESNERVENGHRFTFCDADGVGPVHPPRDIEDIERLACDRQDIPRFIIEKPSGVLVEPPRDLDGIDDTAPIRMEQATQKHPGMWVHDLPLPLFEHNRPLVLTARPRLRKQAHPMLRTTLHRRAAVPADALNPSSEQHPHGRLALSHDCGIGSRAGDPQDGNPSRQHDVSVAKILTEQIGVLVRWRRCGWWINAPRAFDQTFMVRIWRGRYATPVADRVVGDPKNPADFTKPTPLGVECPRFHAKVNRVHPAIFERTCDKSLVPEAGFEPARPFRQRILSAPSLPISPLRPAAFWGGDFPPPARLRILYPTRLPGRQRRSGVWGVAGDRGAGGFGAQAGADRRG